MIFIEAVQKSDIWFMDGLVIKVCFVSPAGRFVEINFGICHEVVRTQGNTKN